MANEVEVKMSGEGELQVCFVAADDVADGGWLLTGGMETTLQYVRSQLEGMKVDEVGTIVLRRIWLPAAEIAASPVL
jgi:hypothetical protein